MKILVPLADGFEETEAVTLIDLLRRAGYTVETASITGSHQVTGGHAMILTTDSLLEGKTAADYDMFLIPGGGTGVNTLALNPVVIDLTRKFRAENRYLAAICAGPFVLEKAGVIGNTRVTAYPAWQSKLESAVVSDETVVVDGKTITSRGLGTSIPMALKIVELVSGKEKSEELARSIVYR